MPEHLTFREVSVAHALNLQGEAHRFAIALPEMPNSVTRSGDLAAFWLGPRSWLLIGRFDAPEGSAAFDVSASRVGWTLEGPRSVDVLAAHCPLDLHASSFAVGTCAQSLFGQVNALYYRHVSRDAWTLFVARSFGRDVAHHLRHAAGQDPGAPEPFAAD